MSIPITTRFTTADDGSAASREVVKLQGCTIYDGTTIGDRDGLLSDEPIQLDEYKLCQFMASCNFPVLQDPTIRVEVREASGNAGFDRHIIRKRLLKTEVCTAWGGLPGTAPGGHAGSLQAQARAAQRGVA